MTKIGPHLNVGALEVRYKTASDPVAKSHIEFEDLILVDAPIEVSGFAPWTRSTDREPEAVEHGPLAPDPGGVAIARRCDMFHRAVRLGSARGDEAHQGMQGEHTSRPRHAHLDARSGVPGIDAGGPAEMSTLRFAARRALVRSAGKPNREACLSTVAQDATEGSAGPLYVVAALSRCRTKSAKSLRLA